MPIHKVSHAMVGVAVAIALLGARPAVASAQTPQVAEMWIQATIGFCQDDMYDEWGTLLAPLSASASTTCLTNTGSISAQASGIAIWLNAAAGSVQFRDFGWEFVNATGNVNLVSSMAWRYGFRATSNSIFSLSGSQSASGSNTFGLAGFLPKISGGPEGNRRNLLCLGGLSIPSSCAFSATLTAGFMYYVALESWPNISGGAVRTQDASLDADFAWSITEVVPEPATMTLLATGLVGLVGAGLRRRRKA